MATSILERVHFIREAWDYQEAASTDPLGPMPGSIVRDLEKGEILAAHLTDMVHDRNTVSGFDVVAVSKQYLAHTEELTANMMTLIAIVGSQAQD